MVYDMAKPSPYESGEIETECDTCDTKRNRDYSEVVATLRSQIKSHLAENADLYDAEDIQKVFNNDFYVLRFYRWCRGNTEKALKMILKCFQWRKSSGVIYRKPEDFPSEFYSSGALFSYQPDLEGRPTLYMRVKFLRKAPELDAPFKDFMTYMIKEIDDTCAKMMSWTIIIDCAGISWCNVHLEMLRYLISTMSSYFPFGINRILILDIPWLLDAIRKMAWTMLPAEAQKVAAFTSRQHLPEMIALENIPDFAEGTCTVPYNQVPEGVKPLDEQPENFYNLNQKQLSKLKDIYKAICT